VSCIKFIDESLIFSGSWYGNFDIQPQFSISHYTKQTKFIWQWNMLESNKYFMTPFSLYRTINVLCNCPYQFLVLHISSIKCLHQPLF
jgi:hypothetical protein